MTRTNARRWATLVLLAACCAPRLDLPSGPGLEEQAASGWQSLDLAAVRRRLWPAPAPRAYAPPTAAQTQAIAALARAMFADPPPDPAALAPLADAAGYRVEGWEVAGRRYLAALERRDRRHGGGAFVVHAEPSPGAQVLLQAPHAFHDLGTERVALDLLLEGDGWPRALFVNTVHRHLDVDGARRRRADAPADPCHNPGHLLAVATAAAIEALPDVEVIQLHGFDEGDDLEEEPALTAIVSAGEPTPTPQARTVAEALRAGFGPLVALYPEDIDRLGATTNEQGKAVRARGGAARFVHVELSSDLRQRLRRDPAALRRFAAALRGAPPDPQ